MTSDTKPNHADRLLLPAAFLLAAAFLLIATKSSPLYPMNDNADLNIFMTVGRGILDGKVPYRDMYEQKGPLLFFLHALLALFFRNSYFGAYLLEVLFFGLFLYYSARVCTLYVKNRFLPYLAMLFMGTALPCSRLFSNTGTIEELFIFAFPFSLLAVLGALREKRLLSFREGFLIGLLAACGFWTKYTFSGFFAALALIVIIWYLVRKQPGRILPAAGSMLAGFFAVTVPVLLYFAVNGALTDLFDVYFTQNMTAYARAEKTPLAYTLDGMRYVQNANVKFFSWLAWPGAAFLLFGLYKHALESLTAVLSFFGLAFTTYMRSPGYVYYGLALAPFYLVGLIGVLYLLDRLLRLIPALRESSPLAKAAALLLVLAGLCGTAGGMQLIYRNCPNTYLMAYQKEELPQVQFGNIMKQVPDATMLHYYFLDNGFYFMGHTKPVNRFFCYFNINPPELLPDQQAQITGRTVDFVVCLASTCPKKLLEESGYTLVKTALFPYSNKTYEYKLYQRID